MGVKVKHTNFEHTPTMASSSQAARLPPNPNVSALLRGSRYIAFFAGSIYGYKKMKVLWRYESDLQEQQDRRKMQKYRRDIAAKKNTERNESIDLAVELKVKPISEEFRDLPQFKDM